MGRFAMGDAMEGAGVMRVREKDPSRQSRTAEHVAQFPGLRARAVQVPCWCALGRSHDYEAWVSGGRPHLSGLPPLDSPHRSR